MRAHLALCAALATLGAPPQARAESGLDEMQQLGCARCHEVSGQESEHDRGCVACHQRLLLRPATGIRRAARPTHYVDAPSLVSAARRLRPDYLVGYLMDPHDVRPNLEETMPRLPVTLAAARAIVAFMTAQAGAPVTSDAAPPDPANVERGRLVFARSGCPSCHVFGNVDFHAGATEAFYRAMRDAALMAPNLRFVRDRMDPAIALAWIRDPTAVDPAARMPVPGLADADATAVRDFLFLADPGVPALPAPAVSASDLAPLARRVHYADVRRIFGRSCIHCHAKTTGARATAALGFAPFSLDLASYDGVLAGSVLADGTQRSILRAKDGGPAPLLARLLARHSEAPRDVVAVYQDALLPVVRGGASSAPAGMPLGLPPLPLEDVRLVATWIAEGSPR